MNPLRSTSVVGARRAWRKLTTKPIWWWQRNRPYPLRRRVWSLPPLACLSSPEITFGVLTTPHTLPNALWTAYSFCSRLPQVSLRFVLDGSWRARDVAAVKGLFRGAVIDTTTHLIGELGGSTAIQKLAREHPMGRKLATILALQTTTNLLYADDDVLAFGRLEELRAAIARGVPCNRYIVEESRMMQAEPAVLDAARRLSLGWLSDINVGLLLIRRSSLDLGLAERLLANARCPATWFPDTAVISVLMAAAGAEPLPDDYLVSTAGQFYFEVRPDVGALEARHYVGPVRHLMYLEGIPKVLQLADRNLGGRLAASRHDTTV